jgi:hypothetical protein
MRIRVVTALLLLLCVACAARRDRGIRSLDSSAKRRSKRLTRGLQHSLDGAKGLLREAKVILSSDFESAFLKATRPDDRPAKQKHVNALISLVEEFPSFSTPTFDPWRPFLHKLWSRCVERDPRTSLKAAYLLHRLGTHKSVDRSACLRTLKCMEKEESKRSKLLYFDLPALSKRRVASSSVDDPLITFLNAYSSFAFLRFRHFDARLSELERVSAGGAAGAISTLKRAQRCLVKALECRVDKGQNECELTASCLELLHDEVAELWPLFVSKVALMLEGASQTDEELLQLGDWLCDAIDEQRAFSAAAASALRRLGVRIRKPRERAQSPVSEDALRALIAKGKSGVQGRAS